MSWATRRRGLRTTVALTCRNLTSLGRSRSHARPLLRTRHRSKIPSKKKADKSIALARILGVHSALSSPLKKRDRHVAAIILPDNFTRTVGANPLFQRAASTVIGSLSGPSGYSTGIVRERSPPRTLAVRERTLVRWMAERASTSSRLTVNGYSRLIGAVET
jgi:hypothetical protein